MTAGWSEVAPRRNLASQEKLDDYWITMPHGGTSTFYDAPIIEGGEIRNEPEYLTDFWTRHAVRLHSGSVDKTGSSVLLAVGLQRTVFVRKVAAERGQESAYRILS